MSLLREAIRRILLQEYKPSREELDQARKYFPKDMEDLSYEEVLAQADLTGIGIQGPDQIERDKGAMRDWHALMKQNPEFVNNFMEGNVQILHSLVYEGMFSSKDDSMHNRDFGRPFTRWIKKFGGLKKRSRNQISCVAANAPIGADPLWEEWDEGNASSVFGVGFGFVLKGYPAFCADMDMMTTTLSAISKGRREFHKNSGQVKRAQTISDAIDPEDWLGADEVILDNWQITGVYITNHMLNLEKNKPLIADAYSLGVPVYAMDNDSGILKKR